MTGPYTTKGRKKKVKTGRDVNYDSGKNSIFVAL
jgi:hypothetical protein